MINKVVKFLNHYPQCIFLISTALYLFLYWQQLYNHEQFILDDNIILDPILRSTSFLDIYKTTFVDVQPIRDLSYWIDKSLQPFFTLSIFKLSNLIYWHTACFLTTFFIPLYFSLYKEKFDSIYAILASSCLLIHPAMTIPVAWISARKHLLAFLFIISASIFLLKYIKKSKLTYLILSVLMFILSVGSHTIYCLWPFWASWTLYQHLSKTKKSWALIFSLIIFTIGFLSGIGNYIYYKFFLYGNQHFGGINVGYDFETLINIPLSFGRYFINLIDFSAVTIYYDTISVRNIIGTTLFVLSIYIFTKIKKSPFKLNFIILFFISCVTFTLFPLGTFVQNTYPLLMSLTVMMFILFFLPSSLEFRLNSLKFFLILLFVEAAFTGYYAQLWRKNIDFITHIKSKEESLDVKAWYVIEESIRDLKGGVTNNVKNLENLSNEMLDLKHYFVNRTYINSVSTHIAFRAYNNFLYLLYSNISLKPEAKKLIMDEVCDFKVIYCNFFYGLNLYNIKDYTGASQYLNLVILQIYKILLTPANLKRPDPLAIMNWSYMLNEVSNLKELSILAKDNLRELFKIIYQNVEFHKIIRELEANYAFMCLIPLNITEETTARPYRYNNLNSFLNWKEMKFTPTVLDSTVKQPAFIKPL